ncbi:MAG: hypothetical protein AB199_01270 [Parcubacteria bacterium C7867-004]|nr:MAG: hypothetical protein AB199_01270 [Parcubacteria bacterium C7867-004]
MNTMTLRVLIVLLALSVLPQGVGAAAFLVTPDAATVGQEFAATMSFAPQGEAVNAVEGSLKIPEGLSVVRVSTGGSALALWPVSPAFSLSDRTVTFVGGSPGAGLPADSSSLLFTLYLKAAAPGTYSIESSAVSGFKADGTGDRVAVAVEPVSVIVGSEAVKSTAKADHAAPNSLTVALGSDTSLFDGAPFVSFFASDAGSGIAAYQAKEGWFGAYKPVDRYYVLADASAKQPVWIRAIDAEGNKRTVHVKGTGDTLYYAGLLALPVLLLLLIIAFLVYRFRPRP